METNRQRMNRLAMMDDIDTVMDIAGDAVCDICNQRIEKNLSPQNPACEDWWCDEAIELWLDEEAEEDDV